MGASKKPHDATRQERKAKKRKLEDAVPDLPGDVEDAEEVPIAEKAGKKRKRDRDADGEDNGAIDEEKEKKKDKKRRKKEAESADKGAVVEAVNGDEEGEKKEKKSKSKKDKKTSDSTNVEPEVEVETVAEEAGPKKSKKERKAERKAKEAATMEKSQDAIPGEKSSLKVNGEASKNGEGVEAEKKSKKNNRNREKKRKGAVSTDGEAVNGDVEKTADRKDKKDARFICFIGISPQSNPRSPSLETTVAAKANSLFFNDLGNLPFSANTASITKHFAAVKPTSVRALTQKDDPTKSKGIAFIEFEGYDHMKTCLKMFHHSMFDDGVSAPRKINVELTYVLFPFTPFPLNLFSV